MQSAAVHARGNIFVGREDELSALSTALDGAIDGRGRSTLVFGESGIGKTRLTEALIDRARGRGVQVLNARCWEEGGAPAFWPWIQLVRTLLAARGRLTLRRSLGSYANCLVQLLPELSELRAEPPEFLETGSSGSPPSEQQRFQVFDALTMLFARESIEQPLLLVIDDLHAADYSSLLLFKFLARQISSCRVLVVGALRDAEPLSPPEAALIEQICHDSDELRLSGLSSAEVAELARAVGGEEPPETAVQSIWRATGGNPLYVDEVVRLVVAEGRLASDEPLVGLGLPSRLRETIRRQLTALPEACRALLAVGAIVGREFELSKVAPVLKQSEEALLEIASDGCAARFIEQVSDPLGRFRFTHALVREGLLELMPATRRARLHLAIAETLEELGEAYTEAHVSDLAHHFFQALPTGCRDKAVEYAVRAGQQATKQFAFEAAATHLERAIEIISMTDREDDQARVKLLISLGNAKVGDVESARLAFLEASALARRSKRWDLFAEAALGFAGEWMMVAVMPDDPAARLLEEAADQLEGIDSELEARVVARLAINQHNPTTNTHGEDLPALSVARAVDDPEALGYALHAQIMSSWRPEELEQRLVAAAEIVDAGRRANNPMLFAWGRFWRICGLMERGDVHGADLEIAAHGKQARETRMPLLRWRQALWQGMRALLDGRLDQAEELIDRARVVGELAGIPDARIGHIVQTAFLRRDRGEQAKVLDSALSQAAHLPGFLAFQLWPAHLYSELGMKDEARTAFERIAGPALPEFPPHLSWTFCCAVSGQICALIGDAERSERLYELLLPHATLNIVAAYASVYVDPVSLSLGLLATTLGRLDDAQRHFEEALQRNQQMGARPRLARTKVAYASMLLDRERVGDRDAAMALLDSAHAEARSLGLGLVETDIDKLTQRLGGNAAPLQIVETARLRREGDLWTIGHRGKVIILKETLGLRYIGRLLRHPRTPFHALTLAADAAGARGDQGGESNGVRLSGDAGLILDQRSREAYRARLNDLRRELEQAESDNNLGSSDKIRAEIEALTAEITRATGPNGRARRWTTSAERARVSVTKAIRAAQKKIGAEFPDIGQHLANSVKTGRVCSYEPEPGAAVVWELSDEPS